MLAFLGFRRAIARLNVRNHSTKDLRAEVVEGKWPVPLGRICARRHRRIILVIGQKTKVQALLDLQLRGWDTRFVSTEQFLGALEVGTVGGTARQFWIEGRSCEEGISAYLERLSDDIKSVGPALEVMAGGDWDLLVTEAQNEPCLQYLMSLAVARGKAVALVPEGATKYALELEPFGESLLYPEFREVTRFVLDEESRKRWISRGVPPDKVQAVGYLGNTKYPTRPRSWIWSGVLSRSLRTIPESTSKTTVLLSVDVIQTPYELARFGRPTWNELWAGQMSTLDVLLAAGYRVLASMRDIELVPMLKERYAGLPVLVTASIPWQTLARKCDAVVTRDSSIGWEAMSKGIPVVVWNYSDYSAFTEIALQALPDTWVKVVRAPNEVASGVQWLTSHRMESREPLVWSRTERVANWIEGLPYPRRGG